MKLLMQDFGKYGVTDMEDKQRLFRLIKHVTAQYDGHKIAQRQPSRSGLSNLELQGQQLDGNAELLDLDAHDGDLLPQGGAAAFQLSPIAAPQPRPNMQSPIGEEEEPARIRVVVRKRPINRKEKEKGDEDIVDVSMEKALIVVNETKFKVDLTKYVERHQFNFDDALDERVTNDEVYRKTVQPLVHTLLKNGRATCFAYGQTGSGKTHTMSPLPIRAAGDLLRYIAFPEYSDVELHVSCFEIYGNKVYDLLNMRKKLNILEDGKRKVVVVGLKEYKVESVEVVKNLIEEANHRRSVGSTAANADSSRSHSIMQFALKRPSPDGGRLIGKISFIDLAGSERGADTFDNNRQTRMEGAEINKSLLALKECIRALDSEARHVPFRGSKLTAVLRDSFVGGQARTVMIANISPNNASVEHTLNTLRYADRVKELRKDKADRAPGGVTPGDADYYAAIVKVGDDWESPIGEEQPRAIPAVQAEPYVARNPSALPQEQGPPFNPYPCPTDSYDEEFHQLIPRRDNLISTILDDEDDLISAHRRQIEETMDTIRQEMALLTDIDQPGSVIDQYVERLEEILTRKMATDALLKNLLDKFKVKLKEEEALSRTVNGKFRQMGGRQLGGFAMKERA